MGKKKSQTKAGKARRAKRAASRPTLVRTWKTGRRAAILLSAALLGAAFLAALLFVLPKNSKREKRSVMVAGELQPSVAERIPFPLPQSTREPQQPSFDDFVGSESCVSCHSEQYRAWRKSTHGRAGGRPDAEIVIGAFDGKPLQFKDAVVVPTLDKEGRFLFNVKQRDGAVDVIAVAAVVGSGRLLGGGTQSYFSEFPDGTLRFLPFDFIRDETSGSARFAIKTHGCRWTRICPWTICGNGRRRAFWERSQLFPTVRTAMRAKSTSATIFTSSVM